MRRLCYFVVMVALCAAAARGQPVLNVQVSTVWRGTEIEGRTLWVSEQSVTVGLDARTQAQVGWQRLVAKGRVRTNRFGASARWYELNRVLREDWDSQLVLSLRRLEGSEGVADVAEGLFTYVAPRVDTGALLSVQRSRAWLTAYRLSYSRTRAGTEVAETVGLSLRRQSARESRWQLHFEGGVYADRHQQTTYRMVLGGGMSVALTRGWRGHLEVSVAPSGFPLAGTPIEGLTAFAVFRPGSLVESWRNRSAAYLSLRISTEAGR